MIARCQFIRILGIIEQILIKTSGKLFEDYIRWTYVFNEK